VKTVYGAAAARLDRVEIVDGEHPTVTAQRHAGLGECAGDRAIAAAGERSRVDAGVHHLGAELTGE
jgi:hypothetical protein